MSVAAKCTVGDDTNFAKGCVVITSRHIILPVLLVWALLAQLSLPLIQMKAGEAGFNAASYICNLNGRAPTSQAQAHIKSLLKLAGKDVSENETPPSEHCANCIMPHMAVVAVIMVAPLSEFTLSRKAAFPKTRPEIYQYAQGPPLGSRAPPAFN